jgi:hypothetical protein
VSALPIVDGADDGRRLADDVSEVVVNNDDRPGLGEEEDDKEWLTEFDCRRPSDPLRGSCMIS